LGWQNSGKLWLDDLDAVEEVGRFNVLRGQARPVTVRNEEGSLVYTEGKDYAPRSGPTIETLSAMY